MRGGGGGGEEDGNKQGSCENANPKYKAFQENNQV